MQNYKRTKWASFLLIIITLAALCSGCVRWPDGPGPGPGESEYQLRITVQVAGEINPVGGEGMYYIVLDANNNPANGPSNEIDFWDDEYYYVRLDEWDIDFRLWEEGSPSIALTDYSVNDDEWEVIISLGDLNDPEDYIEFNVITTDSDSNTYDYLDDNYLTIGTTLNSRREYVDSWPDTEEGGDNFDIIGVTAEIIAF